MSGTVGQLLVIVLLVLLEGVFVSAEIALITVRRSRVEQLIEEGNRGAVRLRRLVRDPGRFLAVVQIGLTFIGFFASAYAAVNLTEGLQGLLARVDALRDASGGIALIIVTALLSLFTITFGELIPKTLALAHPDRFALTLAPFVDVLGRVLGPLVKVLTGVTTAVVGIFGADIAPEARISADELKLIVERGGEQGVLEAEEEQMINAVIELGDRRLHEVMVPRIDITGLTASATFDDAIDTIVHGGHSRIPVYDSSIDEVVGILYAKDLLPFVKGSTPRPALRTLLRTPVFVPESMSIDDLLHEMQRRKVHLAIVLDEYGGTAGLVTIEDLLEEIVGEIQDEYDEEEPMSERISENEIRIDGRASIDDLGELFEMDVEFEDAEEFDTIGGLIYHRIGGIPRPGDMVRLDEGITLTVEKTDGRRVGKIIAVRDHPGHAEGDYPDEADR